MLKKLIFLTLFIAFQVHAEPLHIVAAENFYGDIASIIGGKNVQVVSILNNPQQDPHLFSTSPATAKAIANANIIIYNGLDYDVWMEKLITTHSQKNIIVVADLIHKKSGDNPHIWYDIKTMLVYAKYLTAQLCISDPAHQLYFQQQLNQFQQYYQKLQQQVDKDKIQFHNLPIIATEPLFNEMADSLGLQMYGQAFQLSVMNNTEPSPLEIKDFENHLLNHTVKVLILNNQVSNPLTQRMEEIAISAHIPSIGISELQPINEDYFTWMSAQLSALEKALGE
ncbi:MAG: zinc ABC transporter substrate-binding protein [Gammaproteobacteria bacterium]|nr:zinc ABC transporter substrate-binding protein [Gammaproteobacteria bacterium]